MSNTSTDTRPVENGRPVSELADARPITPSTSAAPTPSGTRPAAEVPRPAPSGTSGTQNSATIPAQLLPPGVGPFPTTTFVAENLPDVPDTGDLRAGHVPDTSRTVPDGVGQGGMSTGVGAADGRPQPYAAPQLPGAAATPRLIVSGVLRVGPMRARRDSFDCLENPDLYELLNRDMPVDTVIEAEPGVQISIVDADTHHWRDAPGHDQLWQHMIGVHPPPDATWASHGNGLKLVYFGPFHKDRALAAAFSLPSAFHVELLTHTRHPRSVSSQHQGASCSRVEFFCNDVDAEFVFRAVGPLTPDQRGDALEALGMQDGGRYDHDRCPIAPGARSDARGCVVGLDAGVYCHRCAGRRNRYAPNLPPGFLPFSAVVANGGSQLDTLAGHFVHWTHPRLVLRHQFSHLAASLLEQAYRRTLQSRWGSNDPRVSAVFNPDLDFVWGDGIWLDSTSLQPTQVDNDAANGLPYVHDVVRNTNGRPQVAVAPVRRAQVKHRTPQGYPPIRPIRDIILDRDHSAIPVIVPPEPRHPIELLDDPLPIAEANQQLERFFPRLSTRYLHACLAAAICADARRGQPPMLVCTGPSGSGKEQHIRLAASFLGEDIVKLALTEDDEKFMRNIGMAVSAGRRFLVFDELGKVRRLSGMSRMLLQISGNIVWRPLYQNHYVHTQVRSAFFFPCVRFPETLTTSQEFCRRTRRDHLHHRVPNWGETSGGDTGEWRDRTADNAHIANSILTHVWRLCHDFEFRFA